MGLISKNKIFIFSKYTDLAASSRLRTFQYVSYLNEAGFEVCMAPFFDDRYLHGKYRYGTQSIVMILKAYTNRFLNVLGVNSGDVIWIEKELFPYLPGFLEVLFLHKTVNYVVDFDDAIFHNYDQHKSRLVRRYLRKKLDKLLSGASVVTVGNSYLRNYVIKHGARNVMLIPTVIDIHRYQVLPEMDSDVIRIGWIGSPSTSKYIDLLRVPLQKVAQDRDIIFVTIGSPEIDNFPVPIEQHSWSLEAEAELISTLHIGVMPLVDGPWERGKCGYKLIQYMACGRPVVASAIGVNIDIVSSDVGYLANSHDEWVNSLLSLIDKTDFRVAMGNSGRKKVEQQYTTQAVSPVIVDIFKQISGEVS